jgi:hypothetical protein
MSRLENAFFGILYCLTGEKEQLYSTAFLLPLALTFKGIALYKFNALSEFAEVAGILLYADNGLSSVIKSIGLAFRFLSLNVSLSNYPDFLIAFGVVSALTTLICVNAFVVGKSFWSKQLASVWSVRLLHTLVSVILEGFFLARYDITFLHSL